MIFYQTGPQKLAGELVAKYLNLNGSKHQCLEATLINRLNIILSFIFSPSKNNEIMLPYFGAFFKGFPVLEAIFVIRCFVKPGSAIIYYGDGFLVRGRQNHRLPGWLVNKIINLFEKKVKISEFYLVDLGYPNCCEESQKIPSDFIIDCLNSLPGVPNSKLLDMNPGKLVVIPMFKSLIHSRFNMKSAIHYWSSVIEICAEKFAEHTFVVIPHPVDPPVLAQNIRGESKRSNVVIYDGMFEAFYVKYTPRIDFVAPTSLGCVSFLKNLGVEHIDKCRLYDRPLVSAIISNCKNRTLIKYLDPEIFFDFLRNEK